MRKLDSSTHTPFPWREGNSIEFLIDGQQFYPAMLNAINTANKYVLMEMYLFESGKVSSQFINAFTSATHRGVHVKILIDAYGGVALSKTDRSRLTNSGVQLAFYNPLMFKKLKTNLFRTHRKYLLIDGIKVFVGGVGITDSFQGKNAWRETVVGPVVADWQTLFSKNFKQWSDNVVPETNVFDQTQANADRKISARLAYTAGGTRLEIKKNLLNRINNSKNVVWLASAYFIPSRKIRKALRKSAINGKDVRLLLPGVITDHPAVRYASRRYYARLLRFGVKIFEYQGRFTHTKMVIVDDWITIGSSNMDRWNFRWNLEANQEIEDKDSSKKAKEIIDHDFKHSIEITYSEWIKRSKYQRIKEWLWGRLDLFLANKI
ncbi:MAG: phospholipase D-like domain-containing protein [Cocleimonas sp.]